MGARGSWSDRHGQRDRLLGVLAFFRAHLSCDGVDRAELRAALDHGSPGREGNEERAIRVRAPRFRLGRGSKDACRKCRDRAAPGRKANSREPLGGGA